VRHFFARRVHRRDPFDGLQARLFGLHQQLIGGVRGLDRKYRLRLDLLGSAPACLFLGLRARLGGQPAAGVGFDPRAQLGRLLAHRVQPLRRGQCRRAQRLEPVAVRFDRIFRGLRVGQRGRCRCRIHRRPLLGQRARTRLGVGAALGGAIGLRLRFDPRDRLVDRV
jgi:hypothetical protein